MKKVTKYAVFPVLVLIGIITYVFTSSYFKSTDSPSLTKVTLRVQWYAQSQFAGYYVAKHLGYYEDEGLDVEIVPSLGAGDTLAVVGSDYFQFGNNQLSNLIRAIDRDVPIKSIGQIFKESNLALLTHKFSNINAIEDFKGKWLSTWWGKEEFMSKILLQMHGMSQNDIKIVDERYSSTKPFMSGKADIVTVMLYNEYFHFTDKEGIPEDDIHVFTYKDYGLNFPEDTLFTSTKMIEYYPDICLKFLRASLRGWKKALKDKDLAVNIVLKYANNAEYNHEMRQLNVISDSVAPLYASVDEIGYISKTRIQDEIDTLYNHNIITRHFDVGDVFDDRFLKILKNKKVE